MLHTVYYIVTRYFVGRKRREPANVSQINKHKKKVKAAASHGQLPHTHKQNIALNPGLILSRSLLSSLLLLPYASEAAP